MPNYQVGGRLAFNNPTYVERKADHELYEALLRGDTCHLLGSCQMGKSSLRRRIQHRIESNRQGYCAAIDMKRIVRANTTANQWYQGIIFELLRNFGLRGKVDLSSWWQEQENFSPIQKIERFIDRLLLLKVPQGKIFIFIDEIDLIQTLKFPVNDFFTLIRTRYNRQADKPEYRRLNWSMFGRVPFSDLIIDDQPKLFNFEKEILLSGFSLSEAKPLFVGLESIISRPEKIFRIILKWTEGQPFLTQKICALVQQMYQENGKNMLNIAPGTEEFWVEKLVRSQFIENWKSQDKPEHFRSIERSLLHFPQKTVKILEYYQKILSSNAGIPQSELSELSGLDILQRSGLVCKKRKNITTQNRIYAEVFNQDWIKKQLSGLRPYASAINAWVSSNYQDESQLLTGRELQEAQSWSAGKTLSDLDYQFLAASQFSDRQQKEHRTLEILAKLDYRNGELKSYLQEIVAAVSELINVNWAVINFCRGNEQLLLASSVELEENIPQPHTFQGTLTGHVIQNETALTVEDTNICQEYGTIPTGYRSYLGVPLKFSTNEVLGTICAFHPSPRKFSDQDIQLVSILAERAVSALENYQLYQKLQETNDALSTVLRKQQQSPVRKILNWITNLFRQTQRVSASKY